MLMMTGTDDKVVVFVNKLFLMYFENEMLCGTCRNNGYMSGGMGNRKRIREKEKWTLIL